MPRPVVEALSPQAYAWHIRDGWLTLSLDPEITRFYLLRGCTYTAAFFLTLVLVNSHKRAQILLQVLVFSGTLQAAYGALMVLSGMELGFFVEKYASLGVATGTFVNRNHLAGYLNMALAAGIGLLMSQWTVTVNHGWRERLRSWLRLLLSPKVRLRIYLVVMVIALVLTRSRMGNIAFFVALGVAAAVAMYSGRRFSWRAVAFFSSFFVVDMLILGRWFGFDKLLQRIGDTDPEAEARVWSNEYTLDIIEKFPLTGSGGGSFYGIFPNFQDAALQGFHLHAHNDYLEFAAELGLPATAVLILFAALAFYSACRVQFDRHTPLYRGAGFAVTMTLVWAALHSLADFNLQIPANALTFVTLVALAFSCRALPALDGEQREASRLR
jgi:O-antigen ligase